MNRTNQPENHLFKITVTELNPPGTMIHMSGESNTEMKLPTNEIERFAQTVDTIDIGRIIAAVNYVKRVRRSPTKKVVP